MIQNEFMMVKFFHNSLLYQYLCSLCKPFQNMKILLVMAPLQMETRKLSAIAVLLNLHKQLIYPTIRIKMISYEHFSYSSFKLLIRICIRYLFQGAGHIHKYSHSPNTSCLGQNSITQKFLHRCNSTANKHFTNSCHMYIPHP